MDRSCVGNREWVGTSVPIIFNITLIHLEEDDLQHGPRSMINCCHNKSSQWARIPTIAKVCVHVGLQSQCVLGVVRKCLQGQDSLITEVISLPNAIHSQWAEGDDYQSSQWAAFAEDNLHPNSDTCILFLRLKQLWPFPSYYRDEISWWYKTHLNYVF